MKPFKLERYFAQYEFSAPFLLSSSDCQALSMKELLSMVDEETLNLWNNLSLSYTEAKGHPLLRSEIANLYDDDNEIMVIAPEEGIYITMQSLLNEGDHVITTFPGYQSLYEIAETKGCRVSHWTPSTNKGWSFEIDDLKALVTEQTKMIVINFPHNPTGTTLSKSSLEEIVQLARSRNIILFSDEMYRFLEYEEKDRLPSVSDLYENGISLSGLSKSFALPGLRIGWLATKNSKCFKKFEEYRDYTTICNSAPGEILALMALRSPKTIIHRNLKIIKTNLHLLDKFFDSHKDLFSWIKPQAGTIAFPRLIGGDVDQFCKNLVKKQGVLLLPASLYDYEGNNFRIGFGRKNMAEALGELEKYLKS